MVAFVILILYNERGIKMLNLTLEQVHSMVEQAKEHGACSHETDAILSYTDVTELLKDENAHYWAYWYTRFVIKGRWVEGEEIIKTDPEWAYCYAHDVIKGRWPEGEEIIKTSPEYSYYYARDVIKD